MTSKLKRLPGTSVGDTLYDAIRAYAFKHDISKAEAIRRLLDTSPELEEFKTSPAPNARNVKSWGGSRQGKIEPAEELTYTDPSE